MNGVITKEAASYDINSDTPIKGQHKHMAASDPLTSLREDARDSGRDMTTPEFCQWMDEKYPSLRHRFHYPKKGGLNNGQFNFRYKRSNTTVK